MLLFNKKDLSVILTKNGDTVTFAKPIKDILKYQHRYNYKFKMYDGGKITVADDYIIDGDTLTVLFGSASVIYTAEGASYNGGGSGGSGGCECEIDTSDFTARNLPSGSTVTDVYFYSESGQWFLIGRSPFENAIEDTGVYFKYDDYEYYYRVADYPINTLANSTIGSLPGFYITSASDINVVEFASFYDERLYFMDLSNATVEYKQSGGDS